MQKMTASVLNLIQCDGIHAVQRLPFKRVPADEIDPSLVRYSNPVLVLFPTELLHGDTWSASGRKRPQQMRERRSAEDGAGVNTGTSSKRAMRDGTGYSRMSEHLHCLAISTAKRYRWHRAGL